MWDEVQTWSKQSPLSVGSSLSPILLLFRVGNQSLGILLYLICKKVILTEMQKCRFSFCKEDSSLRDPELLVAKVSCPVTDLVPHHWILRWDYHCNGSHTEDNSQVSYSSPLLWQGIPDALELWWKCWAWFLFLWEVLSNAKSLKEATSRVQTAKKHRFVFESYQYLSLW